MLLERENHVTDEWQSNAWAAPRRHFVAARPVAVAPAADRTRDGGRYGEDRRFSVSGVAIAVGVHLLLLPVLLGLGQHITAKREARVVAINLSAPPAPPPPAPVETQPETAVLPVTTQPALPAAPLPQPAVVLAQPDPAPAEAVAVVPAPAIAPPAPPAVAAPAVVNASDLGTRMIAGNPPRYPVESRRRKEQGTVELALVLGLDGAVEAISISRSSGFERLDNAALGAVRRWRWSPTLRNGQPVKVRGVVEIPFVLKGA